jgi:hypothetical protein
MRHSECFETVRLRHDLDPLLFAANEPNGKLARRSWCAGDSEEPLMRQFILPAVLATAAIAGFAIPSAAQQPFCIPGRGCVPMTQASYNACYNLALARGESVAWGERRKLDWFIYQCLAGRIPR